MPSASDAARPAEGGASRRGTTELVWQHRATRPDRHLGPSPDDEREVGLPAPAAAPATARRLAASPHRCLDAGDYSAPGVWE